MIDEMVSRLKDRARSGCRPLVVPALVMLAVAAWGPGRVYEIGAASVVLLAAVFGGWRPQGPVASFGGPAELLGEDFQRSRSRGVEPGALHAIGSSVAEALPQSALDVQEALDQIQGLVADAVLTLSEAFSRLHGDTSAQRELIDGMIEALAGGDGTQITISSFVSDSAELLARFVQVTEAASERSVELVERIDDMSSHMDGMIGMLSDIRKLADQTKLLSLNATIEAARAGESGRGFAVVADEVRQLSQHSNQFNDQIQEQLEEMRDSMQRTRDVVHATASRDAEVLLQSRNDLDEMTGRMGDLDAVLAERASRAAGLSEQIGRNTADAVRSLQFEDIVRQVAEHAEDQTRRIAGFAETIAAGLLEADGQTIAATSATIAAEAADLLASRSASPAAQEDLASGSVDLF
jgi:methyl-accepting chemotaxis protein